ncbi:phasin family protein [Propylenella binzhouense]|uniref:Phasin family protein n=1 Tax=Propylenella binzhouense TaxID=2555902 RepID=A0A964T1E5_9HYPH|nr:phasin family protein [Propylenella binzhouense]MYZ46658.1 phasin family protein [Propylenella binzhouense]
MLNGFDDFQKVGKEGMTKALESFGAASKGFQTIAVEAADYSKKAYEDGAGHLERLLGARTLDGAFEAQSEYLKASYEAAVAQATRMSELYLGVAKDVMKPFEGYFAAK